MKKISLLIAGLFVGFLIGSWSPLGQMAVKGATGVLAKSSHLSSLLNLETTEVTVVEGLSSTALRIQSLTISVLPAEDNTDRWFQISDLVRSRLSLDDPGQKKPHFSNLTADEITQGEAIIASLEEANRQIKAALVNVDAAHPDQYLYQAIYGSNNQLIEFFRFNIATADRAPTPAELTALDLSLQAGRQQIAESTFIGRMVTAALQMELATASPANDNDAKLLGLTEEWLASYLLSFDVEDTLAGRMTEFSGLVYRMAQGTDVSVEAQSWDSDVQRLANDRGQLVLYREDIKSKIMNPTS